MELENVGIPCAVAVAEGNAKVSVQLSEDAVMPCAVDVVEERL